jgi:hypothetical protein
MTIRRRGRIIPVTLAMMSVAVFASTAGCSSAPDQPRLETGVTSESCSPKSEAPNGSVASGRFSAGIRQNRSEIADSTEIRLHEFEVTPLETVGKKVCEGIGKVSKVNKPKAVGRFVVVLEENHTIQAAQIEQALMLSRLYREFRLRDVGLEGFVPGQTFDTGWFQKLPNDTDKIPVATRLLKEGEISSVEFAALVYPDLKVFPIDDGALYHKVPLSEATDTAPLKYLIAIAETTVEDEAVVEDFSRLKKRIEDKKPVSADPIKLLLIKASPWVRERYNLMTKLHQDPDIIEGVKLYREIQEKADETGAIRLLDENVTNGMDTLIKFMEGASKRSDSLVRATLEVARKVNGPVAMVIGAGHTKQVCRALESAQQSYLLLTPNSLRDTGRYSALAQSLFDRKVKGLSVDGGLLGEALNKREHPPVRVSQPFVEAKAELYLIIAKIGGSGGGNRPPPPDGTLPPEMDPSDFRYVRVDPATIQHIGEETIFMATMYPDDPRWRTNIWARVGRDGGPGTDRPPGKDQTVDDYLKAALQEVQDEAKRDKAQADRVDLALAEAVKAAKAAEEAELQAKDKERNAVDARKERENEAMESKKFGGGAARKGSRTGVRGSQEAGEGDLEGS